MAPGVFPENLSSFEPEIGFLEIKQSTSLGKKFLNACARTSRDGCHDNKGSTWRPELGRLHSVTIEAETSGSCALGTFSTHASTSIDFQRFGHVAPPLLRLVLSPSRLKSGASNSVGLFTEPPQFSCTLCLDVSSDAHNFDLFHWCCVLWKIFVWNGGRGYGRRSTCVCRRQESGWK